MKNFVLKAIPTANQRMHVYLGEVKSSNGQVVDSRLFLRSIIRHSDLISKEASFDYMKNEGERILLEAMDELDVALSFPDTCVCDYNHVFLNFAPTVTLDPQKVVDTVRDIILRYGSRLWKLRVLQAELKFTVRLVPNGPAVPMHLTVSNESGYYLDLHLYQEVIDDENGQVKFMTWGGAKPGPLHGLLVSTSYQTKDHMQQKRYMAQKMGTTYVYDIPEMFRQSLLKLWKEYNAAHSRHDDEPNSVEILSCVELVLDGRGNLQVR